MSFIQPIDRNQTIMFSSIEDMVEKENAVRIIDLFIDKFISENPKEFLPSKNTNIGAPSYHPGVMLKLYFYGYSNRIKSSRQLETESYRNLELIWLLGDLHPDHWTISNFRKLQGDKIKKVWKCFQKFLKSYDYIDLKVVAIDGTKIKANTRKDMMTPEKLVKMIAYSETKLAEYLQNLDSQDQIDSHQEEVEEAVSNALSESKKQEIKMQEEIASLQKKLAVYKEKLNYMETNHLKRIALSDPDAKLVSSRDGKVPGFNAQSAVDSKHHMIAEVEETTDENDLNQLNPMISKIETTYDELPEIAVFDTGYYNLDEIEKALKGTKAEETEAEKMRLDIYVSPKKEKEQGEVTFTYNKDKDIYECSEGKALPLCQRNKKKYKTKVDIYRGKECQGCPKFGVCTKSKKGRQITRYKNTEFRENYEKKMRSDEGKAMMKLRRCLVEHPFGTIKYLMGKIPLLLRGKEKVGVELRLYAMAYNLKRLIKVSSFDTIVQQIELFKFA